MCIRDRPINVFESWLTVIAVTRNACGHHSRVWNKQNAIQPAIPNNPEGEWITCLLYTSKQHISQLDEKAVGRVTTQLVCAKEELASAKSYNTTPVSYTHLR